MPDFNYHEINDVIHSRIRTAIMAVLISVEEAEFTFIREKINATDGNLSVHLRKLEESNYISVTKEFVERKPISRYRITETGRKAFEDYIKKLESIIKPK
ncbi:MAG: transcriptional regulator [Chlorobi bacterium]|nr:transcriptional regulator [Chlorobiota bacterium]MCI0716353.1 transcriptional regulator [Chlorobiota bacterium]